MSKIAVLGKEMIPPYLKTIAVRPKRDALKHYTEFLDQAREAANDKVVLEAAKTKPDFDRAVRAQRLEVAMRAAQFEANHTGPFNHSGKEIYRK